SILLDGSQQVVNAVSRQPAPAAGGTTLRAVLGRIVSFEEMADAIVAAWGAGAAAGAGAGAGAGAPLRPVADLASLALR
ncbi:MAG: hypothetical protein ACREME_01170, partial [Gemmatimonadales bacterium]